MRFNQLYERREGVVVDFVMGVPESMRISKSFRGL